MSSAVEIQILAAVVAAACALPGVFLVMRRMSLMSDAISHAVLPGIVIMFFLVHSLDSPLLIVGAVLMGVVTVSLTELLERSRLVKSDAAIGSVFPVLFAVGVILVTKFAGDVHLDTDAVLTGELAYAPLDRMNIGDFSVPSSLPTMAVILIVNLVLLLLFYKELKLATFDPGLAAALGFSPVLLHYALMLCTSVTIVGAFNSVGSILVVALMIAPAAAAYLITDRLAIMIPLSVAIGIASAIGGYWAAVWLDSSIGGAMASMTGVLFFLTFIFAPQRGMLALILRRRRQKWQFAVRMLLVHLYHHEGGPEEKAENRVEHLSRHISWSTPFAQGVVRRADSRNFVENDNGLLHLTPDGREEAVRVMEAYY